VSRVPRPLRLALLLAPALAVVVGIFGTGVVQAVAQSLGYQPFLPGWHWTTEAYRTLATDPAVRASLLLTARVSVLSTGLAATLGVLAALVVRRLGRGRRWAAGLLQANLAVPHLVGALCMLLLLSQGGLLSRLTHAVGLTGDPAAFPELTADGYGLGIVAEYVWKETPFIAVLALSALGRGASELEDVARVLGAGRWHRLRRITLPLLAPSVAAGSVLVLAFTAGSYEVPYLLGRPYPATLPVVAYQLFRDTDLSVRPVAMAAAVVITLTSCAVVAAYLTLVGRLARRSP
jgi:putative spermidine/putrescine transport system permease protein